MASFTEWRKQKKEEEAKNASSSTKQSFAEYRQQKHGISAAEPMQTAVKQELPTLSGGKKFRAADVVGKYENQTGTGGNKYDTLVKSIGLDMIGNGGIDALMQAVARQEEADRQRQMLVAADAQRKGKTSDEQIAEAANIAGKTVWSGIGQLNKGVTSTLAFAEGLISKPIDKAFGDGEGYKNWPFYRLNEYYSDIDEQFEAERQEALEDKGVGAQLASEVGKGTVAAIPQALLALATGGGSAAAQGAQLATANAGLAARIGESLRAMVKSPAFIASVTQTLGPAYEEELANGANDLQAAATAIISTALNAGVEIGGGLETLPANIRSGGRSAVGEWVKSMLDEGKEEVIQGVISGITSKALSDPDKEIASWTNEDAIINPGRMAKEFGLGAAVGGLLGGAQIGAMTALNPQAQTQERLQDDVITEELIRNQPRQLVMVQEPATPKIGAEIATEMGIGKNGAQAAQEAGINAENIGAFTAYYDAGSDGKAFEEVKTVQTGIDENTARQAFNAGQMDAIAEGNAEQAKYFGKESKLVKDENFKKAHLSSKDTRKMDSLAKVLGVQIRYVDRIDVKDDTGNIIGEANAQYLKGETGGIIEISLNNNEPGNMGDPFMVSVVHEAIHRIRETSPDIYDSLARFVHENMSDAANARSISALQNVYGTNDINVLTEEQVADAFGRMMQDSEVLRRLAVDNRNVLEKIRDFIRDTINAVNRALNNQNIRLSAEQQSEFADLRARFTEMEALFEDALKQSGQRAERLESTASLSKSGDAMFSLKDKKVPTYGELILKPDMTVVDISTPITSGSYAERRRQIKEQANEIIKKPYLNRDTDTMIFLTKKTYNHAFSNNGEVQINAAEHLPELVENAVLTHAEPSDHGSQYAEGSYTFFGAARYGKNVAPVKLKVMEYPVEGQNIPENIKAWFEQNPELYAAAYDSVVLEVLEIEESPSGSVPSSQPKTEASEYPQGLSDTIKVSDLIKLVNGDAKKYVPSSAAKSETITADLSVEGTVETASGTRRSLKSRDRIEKYVAEYGAIEPGENPFRTVQVPKKTADNKNVSKTVRTILEAQATPEAAIPTIEQMVANGELSYETISDKQAIANAQAKLTTKGWSKTLSKWLEEAKTGTVSKDHTVTGWALYNNAANAGDLDTAMTVLEEMVKSQRNAAQALQATRVLKKLSPEAQLYAAQRSVEDLQEEINERYGSAKAPQISIDPALAEAFLTAKTEDARTAAMAELYKDIGRQMPSTFRDKWNAWRYLAMLGNPRTHVRNFFGNAFFAPVVATKSLTATAIEKAVNVVSGGKTGRSKAIIGTGRADRAILKAAWGDYAKVQDQIMSGGKYSDFQMASQATEKGRRIFKTKALEAARRGNTRAMDVEDAWFSKPHYAYALAGYCKANGITPAMIEKGASIETARAYAIREAQKATYRDTNAFSQMVSELGKVNKNEKNIVKKGVGVVLQGILPFRKTPANILARGVEYSPIGLMKAISADAYKVAKGDMSATEMIDNLSAGLTGTGLLAMGAFLAAQGLIRGHGPDDEKKEFEELQGHQAYSLEIGDTSITLDWLAPECLPFFVGVNLYEQSVAEGEDVTMSSILTAIQNVSEPMLEMSCLQSLNDVFDAVGYASSNDLAALPSILASAANSYLTQGLPTLLGQAERSGQDVRYTTYTTKDSFLTSDMQYTLGSASARIPGWDFQQIPYIDAWGRQESSGGVVGRSFNNFLNPSYTSTITNSKMEDELMRLYDETGEGSVFPSRAQRSFPVDGEQLYLTADEYVKYATQKGQVSYELVSRLVDSKVYDRMSEEERVDAVSDAYSLANVIAKQAVSDYTTNGWMQKAVDAKKRVGLDYSKYLEVRLTVSDIESLKDENGESISNSKGLQIMEAIYNMKGLNDKQRRQLFEDFGVGKTIIDLNKAAVEEKLKQIR